MGAFASKEAAVLEAIHRNDARKLRQLCDSALPPTLLLTPLTRDALEKALAPPPTAVTPPPPPVSRYTSWIGSAPLHVAVDANDTKVLAVIIDVLERAEHVAKEEYAVRDADSLTALSRAVRTGKLDAIAVLIRAGFSVDEVHCDGEDQRGDSTMWTHLRYAAAKGMPHVVRFLLERGADATSWGSDGRRPIHLAVEAGHLECVKVLLEWDNRDADAITGRVRAVSKYIVRECSMPTRRTDPPAVPTATVRETAADTATDILSALQTALQDAIRGSETPHTRVTVQRSNRDRGASLLHLACSNLHPDVLGYLLSVKEFADGIEDMNDSGKTAIFMAIRHGSLHCLKMLVKAGARLDAKDIENWTALHEAVKAGNERTEILNYLIDECNGDVNAVDDDGWTPLHVAARFSSTTAVDILIKAGCDVNAKTEDNETAVLLASAQASSADVLRKLLEHGADLSIHRDTALTPSRLILGRKDFGQLCILLDHIRSLGEQERQKVIDLESRSETGDTLLHVCVHEKNLEATTKVLAVGAKPDIKNHEGVAPLHTVCKNGSGQIADALLNAGADPNLPRGDGMMPLHIASDTGNAEVVDALIQHKADVNQEVSQNGRYRGFSPLMFAARLGQADVVSALIGAGAQLDHAKGDGFTALHLAALNGNTVACKKLIHAGANYRMADETGYFPLQLATRHNQFDVVNIFLESNVEPDSCGELGLTSLHIASFICDARLIWLLIRGGANVNAMNSDDATPLHIAAGREQGRVSMQLLLANGARMDVIDKEKDSPLHNACYKGLYQNVRLLLCRGAEPSPMNENNVTPLHLAAAVGSEETVEALLKYGADVDARDANNKTPYRVAAEHNHRSAMILLFRSMTITLEEIAPTATFRSPSNSGGEDTICVICQNPLTGGEETRTLPCFHTYHNACIMAWLGGEDLTRHDSCPLCQRSVLPDSVSPRRPT